MKISDYLERLMIDRGSQLIFSAGAAPTYVVAGEHVKASDEELSLGDVKALVDELLSRNDDASAQFAERKQCTFAISMSDVGRFRVSVYMQRNSPAAVVSRVETVVPTPNELGLPTFLTERVLHDKGVVVVAGESGQGTSSTFASLVGCVNKKNPGHIVTVEELMQYVHHHENSVVSQREVGVDVCSSDEALSLAISQRPEVVAVSDVMSKSELDAVFKLAMLGTLVILVVKAPNVSCAIRMILSMYPEEGRAQARVLLSKCLNLVFCQRLLERAGDSTPVLQYESLVNDRNVEAAIRTGEKGGWYKQYMQDSKSPEVGTFDQCLLSLKKSGEVSESEALLYADDSEYLDKLS